VDERQYVRAPGYAERYRDQRFATGHGVRTDRRERAALRALLRDCTGDGPWLDVPCGAGRLTDELPGAVQVDRDVRMLVAAGPARPRVCGAASALPFADGAFAGALCMRLLQHLPTAAERIAVLAELRRCSRGPVIVSFFDSHSLTHARRLLRRATGKPRSGRGAIARRTLAADAAAAGLTVRRFRALLRFCSDQTLALLLPENGTAGPRR
jgi:SAM-dependent methyltransferase